SRWNGREAGSFGDFSVLSVGRGQGWTGGGGGALLGRRPLASTLDSSTRQRARASIGGKAVTLSLALWAAGRPSLYRLPTMIPGLGLGETHYHEPSAVVSASPTSSAIASRHAAAAISAVSQRQHWGESWLAAAASERWEERGLYPCEPLAAGESGYLRLPLCATTGTDPEDGLGVRTHRGAAGGYPK